MIPATKIFDNVYIIGNSGTAAYIIKTSAGLLMIDAMAANQVESQVLPGFQELGLNPADVKIIVMGHGHADHFGGSPYFQEPLRFESLYFGRRLGHDGASSGRSGQEERAAGRAA